MRYVIDVKVVGFSEVYVDADTLEEAEEKASKAVMDITVSDLQWKEFQYTENKD